MSVTHPVIAGRYRLGTELGRGGMGVVWEAYDELLHRTVAVKEVHYPPGVDDVEREKLARRTLREARAVAAVEDPHAVRVFDIVEQDGRPWIVMELVRGETLTDLIRARGTLPIGEVVDIGVALTSALTVAHAAGVLHRDVKPSNVLIGEGGRIALTDFGIATVDGDPSDLTTSGQLVGSPAYMAPERARGERPTTAADVWSLGATLWTAAEGQPPYAADNAFATMAKVVSEEPPPCVRCEGPLGGLLRDLMARDPKDRPSLDQVRARLHDVRRSAADAPAPYPTEPLPPAFDRTLALQRPVSQGSVSPAQAPAVPRPRRSALPVVLAVVAALAVAGVIAAFALSSSDPTGAAAPSTSPRGSASAHASASSTPASSTHASPSTSASATSAAAVQLPAGWSRYTDSSVGWSVGVPAGWRTDHSGASTFFRDPAGGRYLQIDTKYPAGPSAKGAWEDQEKSFRTAHPNYQRIALDNVSWRGYPDVADWEFTYAAGAVTLHAVDRGAVVANRGYGLFFQTHADQWDTSAQTLQQIYATFQPGH